jgi:hypothetical protein
MTQHFSLSCRPYILGGSSISVSGE